MELTDKDREDLKAEIDHIFDSGANDIRLAEMMERFLNQRTPPVHNYAIDYPEIDSFYKHYKGGIYKFITMATHSETEEKLAIYKSISFGSVYARPIESWNEKVRVMGGLGESETIPRFKKVTI